MTVRVLHLHEIHVDHTINVSRGGLPVSPQSIASLAEDMRAHGQLEEVGVAHIDACDWLTQEQKDALFDAGTSWLLVYGFRRIAAATVAEFTAIRAMDLGKLTRATAELANVAENGNREPPNDYDMTMACFRLAITHKVSSAVIACRSNRALKFVEDSIKIGSKVSPELLPFYRANCSREFRRRMIELASIDGKTDAERYESQKMRWEEMESADAQERREDPNAGFQRRGSGSSKRNVGTLASRGQLSEAAQRTITARDFWNGHTWVPATSESRELALAWIRWVLNPNEQMPVR